MLNKWIETNTEATWNELHEAIANLPVLSGDESSKRKEIIIKPGACRPVAGACLVSYN